MFLVDSVPISAVTATGSAEFREWTLFGIQALSLLALVIYVVLTGRMSEANQRSARAAVDSLEQLKLARSEETAPYVIVYFYVPENIGTIIHFAIENTGKSPAEDIRLESLPALRSSDKQLESRRPIYKHGVRLLPPGQRLTTIFDQTVSYFQGDERPLSYKVKIKYTGPDGKHYERLQVLDLGFLKGMGHIMRNGTHQLVEEAKKMVRSQDRAVSHLEQISGGLSKGVPIANPFLVVANLSGSADGQQNLPRIVAASLTAWWEMVCTTGTERHFPIYEARSTSGLMAQNVLAALSCLGGDQASPDGDQTREALLDIYGTLLMMSSTTFYADGGASARQFYRRGDHVRRMANRILSGRREADPSQMTLPFGEVDR